MVEVTRLELTTSWSLVAFRPVRTRLRGKRFTLGQIAPLPAITLARFCGVPVFLLGSGRGRSLFFFIKTKKHSENAVLFCMVEVTRLELTTSWSRTKRATKLRYTSESGKYLPQK